MIVYEKFKSITTFAFDVDGVFTNSEILITESGELLRTMNTRDGQAVKYALDQGFKIAIITKGQSIGVRSRFEMLGIEDIYDKIKEKAESFDHFVNKYNLQKEEILFMGDDVPDLVLFDKVGVAACPSDAADDVLVRADFISSKEGGKGCVREVIEKVMKIQDKWVIPKDTK